MNYVFDTTTFIDLFNHYYQNQFSSLWKKFHLAVENGMVVSTREALKELEKKDDEAWKWANKYQEIFFEPSTSEMNFVARIFSERLHFQGLIKKKKQMVGKPCADPFIIAKAQVEERCVVTTEKLKENAAGIPNVCEYYKIECIELNSFMKREKWKF